MIDFLLHGSPPRQKFLPPRLEPGRKFQQEGASIRGKNAGLGRGWALTLNGIGFNKSRVHGRQHKPFAGASPAH